MGGSDSVIGDQDTLGQEGNLEDSSLYTQMEKIIPLKVRKKKKSPIDGEELFQSV